MEALRNFFYDKKVEKVLDIGTGTGKFIEVLKKSFSEAEFFGVDPDENSLKEAKECFPDIVFQKMGAEELYFENDYFDVVSLSMALHHLPKVKRGLKEIKRVVKPQGWIIINELFSDNLNPAQEVQKMYHHFRSRIDRLTGVSHRETFRKEEILQIIRQAGISIQFFFEHKREVNLIEEKGALDKMTEKMKQKLETISERPEFEEMQSQIEEFREKALEFGFQPATNVVIVGRKK
ncbi:methyltransferase domain-containing protein [Maribellus comscasis]|uniref:Methyltransferase domain-containing protein n=1 Tax=Maribellus comscasis TaxID=2681766 RepID=A0A6I6JN81_9BACT|nr:class I SAM-dependent methyltransferase [Maribellus comscasis]QGY44416.1 methyltransferase domain-containing protein [Maribellus comscasis]